MKRKASAYNFRMGDVFKCDRLQRSMRTGSFLLIGILLVELSAPAQQPQSGEAISITTKDLPTASLWNPYSVRLDATGGIEPYHWRIVSGSLPSDIELRNFGELTGLVNEKGDFEFTIQAAGSTGAHSKPKKMTLKVETPLRAEWSQKSRINGNRIEGSIKVSNTTGRDFDLTFAVLAVNDIGRATAIGYQRFRLKKNTKDMELPFGDTLSSGNYIVNVDVVGEEPVSRMIFRARLVTPKQSIVQGP